MTILVVGANGATGSLVVRSLLDRGHTVRAMVRSSASLPDALRDRDGLSEIRASILDLSDLELARYVQGCTAIISCLGHNLSWQGVFGQPRRLVVDATGRLCAAVKASDGDGVIRFVLMNTAGNSNRDLNETTSRPERILLSILRTCLPPHADNERAADYLRVEMGQGDKRVEWVVVRPDTLTDDPNVTEYDVHPSPVRSAIFNPGKTSRVNVADFMARLVTEDAQWMEWRGQMPVVYNALQ